MKHENSGLTIIKNAVKNDYPIKEAILSILPVVDEMVVAIGDSEDSTEDLIRPLSIPIKIKIVHSVWGSCIKTGGSILAVETNKAFEHYFFRLRTGLSISREDEVIHEKYPSAILEAAKKFKDDKNVEGLLFTYLHLLWHL
jgi:hypothetical protein